MKRLLVVSMAVIGLAACTSTPDYRKPSNFSDSVTNSYEASLNLSGTVVNASVAVSKVSVNGSQKISAGLSDILGASADVVKDVAIIGWGVSRDSSAVVIASASEASKVLHASANQVITTSGNIFQASLNGSKTAVGVSVELAKDSSQAVVKVGGYVVGFVKLSADTVSDAALWTSEKTSNAAAWSVDKTGQLIHSSSRVIGYVVDASGHVVSFVLDKSDKILTVTSDASVAVIHSSGDALSSLANEVKQGLKSSGNAISATIKFSAQKTLIVLQWSAGGVSKVSKFLSNSIRDILHSAPEVRPTPGSSSGSAALPGSSSPN